MSSRPVLANDQPTSSRRGFVAAVLLGVLVTLIGRYVVYQIYFDGPAAYERTIALQRDHHIPSGCLVVKTNWFSKAWRIGLVPGDIITKYNGDPVVDYSSYRKAVDKNLGTSERVTLTVARAAQLIEITAPPGLLGFSADTWTQRRDEILDLVQAERFADASAMFSKAAAARELSDYDLVLCGVSVLPDNDDTQDRRRVEMVSELVRMTEPDNLSYVGNNFFYHNNQYKAAAQFFEEALKIDPSDIPAEENLGLTYATLGRFEEADRIADDVLNNHRSQLSAFGASVALKTKGFVLDGRGDYAGAAGYFRQALDSSPGGDDMNLRLRYLLALAKLRDPKKFEEGVELCNRNPGDLLPRRPFYVDALRAYVLVASSRKSEAVEVVNKWRNNPEARRRVPEYWSRIPNSADILQNWSQLLN